MTAWIAFFLIGHTYLLDLILARHALNMCPCPDNNQISKDQNRAEVVPRHEPYVQTCPTHSGNENETEVKIIEDLIVHFSVFKAYIQHVIADHRKKAGARVFNLSALKSCMPSEHLTTGRTYSNEIQRNMVYKEIYSDLNRITIFVDKMQHEITRSSEAPFFNEVHYRFIHQSLQSELSHCFLKHLIGITSSNNDTLNFTSMKLEKDIPLNKCGSDWDCRGLRFRCRDKEFVILERLESLIRKALHELKGICINILGNPSNELCGRLVSLRF